MYIYIYDTDKVQCFLPVLEFIDIAIIKVCIIIWQAEYSASIMKSNKENYVVKDACLSVVQTRMTLRRC